MPVQAAEGFALPVARVLRELVAQLANALQAGERLRDLAADRDDLDDRSDQEAQVESEGDEGSDRHPPGLDLVRTDPHDRDADDAQEQGRERRDGRESRHRTGHVAEQPVHAPREHQRLAPLGPVGLDDPDSGEGLGQAAGDLGVDLGALAEERPQGLERVEQHEAEEREHRERDQGQLGAEVEEDREREDRRQQAPGELDQAGADQVADAFRVGHDPRQQDSRLGLVEEGDLETADVRLDAAPHLGDGALGGLPEHLGQRIPGDRLDQGRAGGREHERHEQLAPVLSDDVVQQDLGQAGKHQAGEPGDGQQAEPQGQAAAPGVDQLRGVPKQDREGKALLLRRVLGPGRASLAPFRLRAAGGKAPSGQAYASHEALGRRRGRRGTRRLYRQARRRPWHGPRKGEFTLEIRGPRPKRRKPIAIDKTSFLDK